MKELTDKCEHCGNLNRSGATHCDVCGKGLSANLAVIYKKYTRKILISFILCIVCAIAAVIMVMAIEDNSGGLLPFITFLLFASVLVFICLGISFLFKRTNYRYSDNTELALKEKPGEELSVKLPAGLAACPSCGNTYRIKKERTCKYCGYDFINQTGESGKSRLSDEMLVNNIEHYSKRFKLLLLLSLPFLLASIIAFSITEEFSLYSCAGIAFGIAFFILVALAIKSANTATEMFKANVVRDALAGVIEGCVYRSKLSISRQRIEAANLIGGWNKFRGNDYIRGLYRGHQIEFSDILLEEEYETGSGDDKRTVTRTMFHGAWITCRLDKKLPAVVRLREGYGKGNAETENEAFNSKYAIYTDDPHYMFYVLTPHFMEYIVAADEAANARTFFCFAGDMVHIAVDNGHDAFEIPANKEVRRNPSIAREQVKSEMKYVTDILDELLLNENLFGGSVTKANE